MPDDLPDLPDLAPLAAILAAEGLRGPLDDIVVTRRYRRPQPGAGLELAAVEVRLSVLPPVPAAPQVLVAAAGIASEQPPAPPSTLRLAYARWCDELGARGRAWRHDEQVGDDELRDRLLVAAMEAGPQDFALRIGQTVATWCAGLEPAEDDVAVLGLPMAQALQGMLLVARHGEGLGRVWLDAPSGEQALVPYEPVRDREAFEQAARDRVAQVTARPEPWQRLQALRRVDEHLRTLVPAAFVGTGADLRKMVTPPVAGGAWDELLARSATGLAAAAAAAGLAAGIPRAGAPLSEVPGPVLGRRVLVVRQGADRDRILWPVSAWLSEGDTGSPRTIGCICVIEPEHR
ncbi:hypothetical protein Cs7R123_08960 [Catellatospora sp. TT07R-123]|uniref:hypothetical protein n=1 Tax=Catellatospora sp. TT07R-123 TaxID=2733863 RepID=UPI001B12213A|nr:hypothetical protein [Catellatospora sp. TT07R-123]GHJ43554.1 hypothetical protein Cs7R123_08960 [Catellatospora sp. TT07R-123]